MSINVTVTDVLSSVRQACLQALPRPPRGPGDGEEDKELPAGDPPDDDETDDPDDEDEGEEDDEPVRGALAVHRSCPIQAVDPRRTRVRSAL